MFGLRRFRFRSPERNRENEVGRLARIKAVTHSALLEAEAEMRGLRVRIARTRRSVVSLLAQVRERETDPACRAELANLERTLLAGERSLAQLEDHLTALRKLERRLDRLIDQPRVSALASPQTGPPKRPDN
jgi:chromosome segregation ATPase